MPILPSVAHSYKTSYSIIAVIPWFLNISLNSINITITKNMLLIFCTYISSLNKYRNVVYEVTYTLHKSFYL
jgi:hypothetical protein